MNFRNNKRRLLAGRLLHLLDSSYLLAVRVLGGREGAESVVQRAYLEALGRLDASERPGDETLWFLGAVVRAGRDHLRGEVVRVARWAVGTPRRDDAHDAEPGLAGTLRRLIDRLEERHRLPLSLCFEHGLAARDAAAVLGLPEATVERHAHDAVRRLCDALLRRGLSADPEEVRRALRDNRRAAPESVQRAVSEAIGRRSPRPPSALAVLPYYWRAAALISLLLILMGGSLLLARLTSGDLRLPWRSAAAAPPAEHSPGR